MTSPYVTLPTRGTGRRALLACVAVVVLLLGVGGALLAAFAALVTWSGCFISCTGENHVGGMLIAAVGVLSLASGPVAVSGLYRSAAWMWCAFAAALAGGVLAFLMLVAA